MTIIFDDVSYKYPGAAPQAGSERAGWALRHLSLTIEPGELVGVIGRNGAGKSTLCLTLNGLVPHFFKGDLRGRLTVNGRDTRVTALIDQITHVGVLFQNPFDQLTGVTETVYEEIAFGPENLGLPRTEIISRVEGALRDVGIQPLAERHPFALSGGQQQRVALAALLAMQPKILVLDEPTSQLDPIGSDEVFEIIRRIHAQGYTIIVAEHKMEALAELATRLLVLSEGKLVMDGPPRTVLAAPELARHQVLPPRYTLLWQELARRGLAPAGDAPLTLDEAEQRLRQMGAYGAP